MSEGANESLAAYLSQLTQDGQHHSQGAFQVDLSRSARKINEFQFKDPHYFLRHLVSAGTALQASRLRLEVSRRQWTVQLDAVQLSFDEMKQVFSSLANSQPGRRQAALRELGLALANLHGMNDCSIWLFSGRAAMELTREHIQVTPVYSKTPTDGLRVEVRAASWVKVLFTIDGAPSRLPKLDLSRFRREIAYASLPCQMGPPPLTPPSWLPSLAVLRVLGDAPLPDVRTDSLLVLEERHSAPYSFLLSARLTGAYSGVTVLCGGVPFSEDVEDRRSWGGTQALLCLDGLKCDLSGRKLVRGPELEAVLQAVQRRLPGLVLAALEQAAERRDRVELEQEIVRSQAWVKQALGGVNASLWREAAILQPGGWNRRVSLVELRDLLARQQFLHYDPESTPHFQREILRHCFPDIREQTPYSPLSDDPDAILQVATACAELKLRRSGAPQLWWQGEPREHPLTSALPAGLHVLCYCEALLSLPPTSPYWEKQFVGLLTVLAARAEEFLGSPAALRLALWFVYDTPSLYPKLAVDALRLRFGLRLHDSRSPLPLGQLEQVPRRPYLMEDQAAGLAPGLGRRALVLHPQEWKLLQERVAADFLVPYEDSVRQMDAARLEERFQDLADCLEGQHQAARIALLREDEGHLSVLYARSFDPALLATLEDHVSRLPLHDALVKSLAQSEAWSSFAGPPAQVDRLRPLTVSRLFPFFCCVLQLPDEGKGLVYVDRRLHAGPWQPEEQAVVQERIGTILGN